MTLSTADKIEDLKLPALKALATEKGITLDKVREYGYATLRTSWIAALQAPIAKKVDRAVDTVQTFTNDTQDQAVAIVAPIVAIVAPMVDATVDSTQTAIRVVTPTAKQVITVVKRVVTVENITHLACVTFVLLHFISILSYEAGKVCGDYYRTIAPMDPYGRVMQITADIGSVIHRADPRSVCLDWEYFDRLSGIARGVITMGYEVCGIVAIVAPLLTGLIIYKFVSATEYAIETIYINSTHYVATRDQVAF